MMHRLLVKVSFVISMVIGVSIFSVAGFLLIGGWIATLWLSMAILACLILCLSTFFPAKISEKDKGEANEPNQSPFKNFALKHARDVWHWDFPRCLQFLIGIKHVLKSPSIPDKPDNANYHSFHIPKKIIERLK